MQEQSKSETKWFTFTVVEFRSAMLLGYFLYMFPHIFKRCVFVPECLPLNAALTVLLKVNAMNLMRKRIQQLKYHLGLLFLLHVLAVNCKWKTSKVSQRGVFYSSSNGPSSL